MIETLLSPAYAPFAVAFAIMIGVGLIEAIGLGIGQFDLGPDIDAGNGGVLDWLGGGSGLPILIWLTSLLACFTLVGLVGQQAVTALTGAPLHPAIAATGALVVGGILNQFAATGLARIMPGYESTIVSTDDLLRRRGTILEGTAARGRPARAKVVDRHGQAHYVMVEPHGDGEEIAQGQTALLVAKKGAIFLALPDVNPVLSSI